MSNRDQAYRRFRAARPGSVLIFVVALLVLIALIATAFLSTARNDRYSAAQHVANTELDLLVEGIVKMTTGAILEDLKLGDALRAPGFENHDNPYADLYLGSRVPEESAAGSGIAVWPSVSWPLIQNGTAADPYRFDTPANGAGFVPNDGGVSVPKSDLVFFPTSGVFNGETTWPHLRPGRRSTGAFLMTAPGFPAADTDGDGIADAGLWKLTGSLNGVTYYAALRVMDNNSAVNASVAWRPQPAGVVAPVVPGNFFPTNIDLVGLLKGAPAVATAEMAELNKFRFSDPAAAPVAGLVPHSDGAPGPVRTAAARADFTFGTEEEAVWHQLGRRLGYPGFNTAASSYVSVLPTDSISLAYRFLLENTAASDTRLEQALLSSLTAAQPKPYAANDAATWFTDNFDFPALGTPSALPVRPLLVTRNPVVNATPSHSVSGGAWLAATPYNFGDWVTNFDVPTTRDISYVCIQPNAGVIPGVVGASEPFWASVPWQSQPIKANVNTASFGELWHAYWDVMIEGTSAAPTLPGETLIGMANTANTIFRPAMRSFPVAPVPANAPVVDAYGQLLIRSALAAINTIDLRDSDNDISSRKITLHTRGAFAPTYEVVVYGAEAQPYITEVLTDPTGYVAVELYNPYPFPILMTNWEFATLPRGNPTVYPLVMTRVGTMDIGTVIGGTQSIPANGYLLVETVLGGGPGEAQILANIALQPVGNVVRIGMPTLGVARGTELVLLRPRRADGTLTVSVLAVNNTFNEGVPGAPNLHEMAPADQVDLFAAGGLARYEYRRGNAFLTPGVPPSWKWHFVYPGVYDRALAARHFGLLVDPASTGNLAGFDGSLIVGDTQSTFPTTAIQIANLHMGGPNKTIDPITNAVIPGTFSYPFGGFARNGDLLQIPFIGAYRVTQPGAPVPITGLEAAPGGMLELNSLTMDSAFADDTDPGNNGTSASAGLVAEGIEQIGRFGPTGDPTATPPTADYVIAPDPVADPPGNAAALAGYRYRWAMDLLDFLTVQSPASDFLPDVDPAAKVVTVVPHPIGPEEYPGPPPAVVANVKQEVANNNALNTPAGATEESASVEGLININTAGWRVLATIPFTAAPATNELIAKGIVHFRDGTTTVQGQGPFTSIYDLYRVPEFSAAQDAIIAVDPDDAAGDISPFGAGTDAVRADFEERFLLLNRMSNLITTRSDSYTCYVLVQGWRDAGTANPTLVVQRRVAFIVDRSNVTPANASPGVTYVPNN